MPAGLLELPGPSGPWERRFGGLSWLERGLKLARRRGLARVAVVGPRPEAVPDVDGVRAFHPGDPALAAWLGGDVVRLDPCRLPGEALSFADPDERRALEKRLLAALVKPNESFMSRHVERRLSIALTCRLAETSLTPDQATVISAGVGLSGAVLFAVGRHGASLLGALLFLAHSILDGCDGELARLKLQESPRGARLDFWSDNVVHAAAFLSMGIGLARSGRDGRPLALGLAAAAAVAANARWVAARALGSEGAAFTGVFGSEGGAGALDEVLDYAARREFIYLVVLLAAVDRLEWFLTAAALGGWIYAAALMRLGAGRLSPPRASPSIDA